MTTYFKAKYDTLAGGSFTGEGTPGWTEVTWPGGGRGQIIQNFEDGTTGKLHVALIAGALPTDTQILTQGAVTAIADGAATTLLYPAYFRLDVDITDVGNDKQIDWDTAGGAPVADGNGIIPTHSLYFDGQTVDLTVNQVLTFSGGQTAELVNIIDQTGADGEIEVRFISNLDAGLPVDGDTFTDEGTGDGTVQGEVHPRSYTPLNLHRLLADLNDDDQYTGDDVISMLDATPSAKDTDQIVRLIGGAYITDTVALHMYGGSIAQNPAGAAAGGDTKFSGLDVQVTSPNTDSRPILIQYDITTGLPALITDKWSNAWNPDSIAGNVRIMVKTRENGVDIDGRRVKGKLLEFGDSYFEGATTLGDATTSLALFASTDGNNQTAVGTVAGAPYNTIVLTDGLQTIDYNNGNGATEFALSLDYGTATSAQAYERTKYVQRRGTAETLFGLNGQLVTGVNRNFAYDAESNGPFLENALVAWGTIVAYDGESGGPFTQGESLTFSGGATGRLLFLDDDGLTGTLIVEVTSGTAIGDDETITGSDSGATAVVNDIGGVDVIEARSGTGWLIALDDDGTTGNLYYQRQSGLDPVDDQPIYGLNAGTLASCLVNGAIATRTINNQFIGVYTGTNYQTNFGIGIDSADAILGDLNRNLADVQQGVPNNQTGTVGNLRAGDRVTVYPWDGSTLDANGDAVPDMTQLNVTPAIVGAAVTSIVVTSIPNHTPQVGALRMQTTAGGKVILVPYTSHDGSTTFTCPAFDFSGANNIDNNAGAMVAYIDTVETVGTDGSPGSESYTAVYVSASTQLTVTVRRGDTNPIVPFKANPTFGSGGFSVDAGRISDA
jgi:hypothetical protein